MSSTLSRFRKPGGFQQLLNLMETSEPAKRETLFKLIASEDPGWARLVLLKSLSFDRIISWPAEALMELTPYLSDQILVLAFKMARDKNVEFGEKWLKSIPPVKAREVRELSMEMPMDQGQKVATALKVIQTVRELESRGTIKLANLDPTLEFDSRLVA
jgi:flagellar motor switch protein FliG